MTQIFAHRGASKRFPENTMEAFIAAEKYGADGIELDVQLTRDGEVVVIHDTTVDRTTNGSGYVKDFTLAEIKKLKANYHYRFIFQKATQIPTLEEVFIWMKGNEILCNVELKNNTFPYEGLEEKVLNLIKKYGYEERIIISSFNHDSLMKVKKYWSVIETAPLYNYRLEKPWNYAKFIQANSIHPKLKVISEKLIKKTQENGIAVRPYTVNKDRDIARLFKLQCHGIITDVPEKAVKIKQKQ